MAEIDLNNIVDTGRRTRGKVIDFAKAAQETRNEPFPGADEDEDEDDDYEAPHDEGMEH
jgi:Histone chaperone domain CHZ